MTQNPSDINSGAQPDESGSEEFGGGLSSGQFDSEQGGESPADSGAGDQGVPGEHDGGADGGADSGDGGDRGGDGGDRGGDSGWGTDGTDGGGSEGPADSGAGDQGAPGEHDGGADGGADSYQ